MTLQWLLQLAVALSALTILAPAGLAHDHEKELKATVVEVVDGDTVKAAHDGRVEIVELLNIDAPDPGQPNAERAKHTLEQLCLKEEVRILWTQRDADGAILGTIHEEDGLNVSFEMVKAGMAWNYQHFEHDRTLAELETEARKAHRGIWADRHPTPPWEYRKQHQKPELLGADTTPKRR